MANDALVKAQEQGVKNLSESAAKSALGQALSKVETYQKKLMGAKEVAGRAGQAVVETALTQGTLFLGSVFEGAAGDWVKPMGIVDVRPAVALPLLAYAAYDIMNDGAYGEYALATANGLFGSWFAGVGVMVGQAAKEKFSKGGGVDAAGNPPPANVKKDANGNPIKDPTTGLWVTAGRQISGNDGPSRDVTLSPPRRGGLVRASRRNRDEEED